jgi:hypothetical protein
MYAVADDTADAKHVKCFLFRKTKKKSVEKVGIESYGDH